jgi:hypothetical protein
MSRNRFAKENFLDKSAVSRYLNGKRVPLDGTFLDRLLELLEEDGGPVPPQERNRLVSLHLAALQEAHPLSYRIRIVNDKLQLALASQQLAERHAAELQQALSVRTRQLKELTERHRRLKTAWDADRAALQTDKHRLASEVARLERELQNARRQSAAAVAWVGIARTGLLISATYLEGNPQAFDRLLNSYGNSDFARLPEHFVIAGILAVEVLSMGGKRMSYDQALRAVTPCDAVTLFDEFPVGPWSEVLALAAAYRNGGDPAARAVPLTMDVPSAVNASFRFAISALVALTEVPDFPSRLPAETAHLLIEGLDVGYAAA